MASLGHIAVGLAATRIHGGGYAARRSWLKAAVLWSLLSLLPDADVIGLSLGVKYEDEWGHRGATHSLVFSSIFGLAIGVAAPFFRLPAVRTAIVATLVLASHALLDTLTNGGLGCALFWPFDHTRYFAPWTPIPVAPIGLYFFSPYGLMVAAVELLLFAPLLWFAMSPSTAVPPRSRGRHTTFHVLSVTVWLVAVWLLTSGDPIREGVVGVALRDDTEFTRGYSDQMLGRVTNGEMASDVRDRLGLPFFEHLFYPDGPSVCVVVRVDKGTVMSARPPEACRQRGIEPGASREAVLQALGTPVEWCWSYSRSPSGGTYRARAVCFANDRVTGVVRRWFRD